MPFLPMTKPGFLVSIMISPRLGSKYMSVISASAGISSRVIFSASTSDSLTEGSGRTTILLRITPTISAITLLWSTRISGFFGINGEHGSLVFDAGDFCLFGDVLENILSYFDFIFVLLCASQLYLTSFAKSSFFSASANSR